MDLNAYALEHHVRARLADARAAAALRAQRARPGRAGTRASLGTALIALGAWLQRAGRSLGAGAPVAGAAGAAPRP